jgi:hypothetical protein
VKISPGHRYINKGSTLKYRVPDVTDIYQRVGLAG